MHVRSLLVSMLVVSMLVLTACTGSTPTRVVPEFLCGGHIPSQCGVTPAECQAHVDPIVHSCVDAIGALMPNHPTDEHRQRAAMLALMCSIHVYRQRRALDGHPCRGDEIPREYRSACTVCSAAAGIPRRRRPGS